MHTRSLDRLEIVSVCSLRDQTTTRRTETCNENKQGPAKGNGQKTNRPFFTIASFVYSLQKLCFGNGFQPSSRLMLYKVCVACANAAPYSERVEASTVAFDAIVKVVCSLA